VSNPFFYDEADIAQRVIWKNQNAKSQCSIGQVVSINTSPVSVNIQPLVNYFDLISKWETYPVLNNIPVAQMQTATYSFNTPLNIGDTGLILWFDREVYTTLLAGATTTQIPNSGSMNDVNACVFLPLMQAFSLANQLLPNGVDFISSEVSLMTQLLNLLTQLTSLLTELTTFNTALETAGLPYVGAPTMPVVGAYPIAVTAAATASNVTIATISTAIGVITTMLTTFKGAQT